VDGGDGLRGGVLFRSHHCLLRYCGPIGTGTTIHDWIKGSAMGYAGRLSNKVGRVALGCASQ
jgi:hypothetical protein